MNVVIDGMQHMDINMIEPVEIGAMEIYGGASTTPMEYASGSPCGAIVIWTKQSSSVEFTLNARSKRVAENTPRPWRANGR